jgi:hypothetical protein
MIEARIGVDGLYYTILVDKIDHAFDKFEAKLHQVQIRRTGDDVTARAEVEDQYGTTPGDALDKVFAAARAKLGDAASIESRPE